MSLGYSIAPRNVVPKDSRLGVPPVRRCSPPYIPRNTPGQTAAAKVFIHAAGIVPLLVFSPPWSQLPCLAVSGQLGFCGLDWGKFGGCLPRMGSPWGNT